MMSSLFIVLAVVPAWEGEVGPWEGVLPAEGRADSAARRCVAVAASGAVASRQAHRGLGPILYPPSNPGPLPHQVSSVLKLYKAMIHG